MKDLVLKLLYISVCLVVFSFATLGQQTALRSDGSDSVAGTLMKRTGKAAVIVVGSAGRALWVTGKFVGKRVAWPVAKTVLVKAPEKAAVYGLKLAGFSLKQAIPMAARVGLAYLKKKLP